MSRSEASTCQIPKQRSRSWSTHQIQGLQFVRGHSHLSTNNGPQIATCPQDKALLTLLIQRILLITSQTNPSVPFHLSPSRRSRRHRSLATVSDPPNTPFPSPTQNCTILWFQFSGLEDFVSEALPFDAEPPTQTDSRRVRDSNFQLLIHIPNRIWNSEEKFTEHWISVSKELLLRRALQFHAEPPSQAGSWLGFSIPRSFPNEF